MLKPSAIVELVLRDETGTQAALTLFTPSSLTVDTIAANAEAFAAIVLPLTRCSLVAIRVRYVAITDPPAEADGPSRTSHALALFFAVDGSASGGLVTVPGINDSVFVSSGPGAGAVLDLTNADVSALVSAILDAGFCTPFAVPFLDVSGGYLQSRV